MDHDSGLDVPGTLEINARIMIPTVLFHRLRIRGGEKRGSFETPVRDVRESICLAG